MLDRFTGMAVFVKAVELGSFTAAGTALGMTSQMVGKHVAALEQRLGGSLLHRSTRRQQPTELGELFYQRCRVVLAEVEGAEALAEDSGAVPRGRLRVSAPVGFGALALAPVLANLSSAQPALEVELILTDRYVDLVDEGFDAVMRLGPLGETSLAVHELALHDQVACASPSYLAVHGAPTIPDDLQHHRCLGFVNASGRLYGEWRFGEAGQIHKIQIRAPFRTNDGRTLVAAAVAGHGIILQPRAVVANALADGSLVPVLADYVAPARPMYLLHSPREPQPARLTALVDCIILYFSPTSVGQDPSDKDERSSLLGCA
jgi:DNA-binding transcriptional LysR family regulator